MTRSFSLTDPLPKKSISVLEASAGTGKTFAISALVARYICAGISIEEILIVTFTKSAAKELASRVRERLKNSLRALRRFQSSGQIPEDAVDQFLIQDNIDSNIDRLSRAISEIDLALITTIHEYSSRMLNELGIATDHDQASSFIDNLDFLIQQLAADLYISKGSFYNLHNYKDALEIARSACQHTNYELIGYKTNKINFGLLARAEYEHRKRLLNIHDFDDMINRLANTLTAPETRDFAAGFLSNRFKIVLVDEFQDTDSQQWKIFKEAFGNSRSTVILIGDPKQAIYRFRGGDVDSYLDARASADQVFTMKTNYRSDPGIVDGISELFNKANLGTPNCPIAIPEVSANKRINRIWHKSQPVAKPMQIRIVPTRAQDSAEKARDLIYQDVVEVIKQLTTSDSWSFSETLDASTSQDVSSRRRIRPKDIAILVPSNDAGVNAQRRLEKAGIAAIFSGNDSVFETRAAADWRTLLTALVGGQSAQYARACLTCFFALTSSDLSDNDRRTQAFATMRRWAHIFEQSGIAAVFELIISDTGLATRLLSELDGARILTDLKHLVELMSDIAQRQQLSATGILKWLEDQMTSATDSTQYQRRLESERDAVSIMTIHKAKGLEFPVVLLPHACDEWSKNIKDIEIGHNGAGSVIDFSPGFNKKSYEEQKEAENLRLFYVACTRASSFLVSWWAAHNSDFQYSPLHRLACNVEAAGMTPLSSYPANAPFREFTKIAIRKINLPKSSLELAINPDSALAPSISFRRFSRNIDYSWRRTSYSRLTAGLHGLTSMQIDLDMDEPLSDLEVILPTSSAEVDSSKPLSSLADLPGGTSFGSLVHHILELSNPSSTLEQMIDNSRAGLEAFSLADISAETLGKGLFDVLNTGLGTLTDGASLAQIGLSNRLAELEFEFSLGGKYWHTLAKLARLFDVYPSNVFSGYGEVLANSSAADQQLHGFLTGSIDALIRHRNKYVVLDYKTNRIPNLGDRRLTADLYHEAQMESMMRDSNYPLQALLYEVALHRFLAWRLPDYDPKIHLGGVGYLFVRGMVGADTPKTPGMPLGVFIWHPPYQLIVKASEILAGEGA